MTKSQGIELAKSQLADGWPLEDIKTYFELLEGVQFANWIYNQLYYVYCAERHE